jgi:hypothetical protein
LTWIVTAGPAGKGFASHFGSRFDVENKSSESSDSKSKAIWSGLVDADASDDVARSSVLIPDAGGATGLEVCKVGIG